MKPISWTDDLTLDYEPLDRAHRDFVGALATAQTADDAALPEAWTQVVEHARAHFDLEDAWMRDTRFAAAASHIMQHRVVLNVLREGQVHARQGRCAAVREMADELAAWFTKHTQAQDAALALHMRRLETLATPPAQRHKAP